MITFRLDGFSIEGQSTFRRWRQFIPKWTLVLSVNPDVPITDPAFVPIVGWMMSNNVTVVPDELVSK